MKQPLVAAPDTEADVTALQTAVATADRLLAHYQQGISYATDLKRTLVRQLLRKQYTRLSIDEEAKLLKSYGLYDAPPKT